ncbi:minor capsid protein [Hespellia stercorisuis]|uniref:Phage putative head morphogenesis protein, SPP1 gp7 family n=1 Tax=Hespellia stercorisuis DSM 15480 TaxID=1121950 RepID=A0A1M6RFR1_9FIRM|nr:minor capsid protein [Hespellia stercorisuis]SHK31233.1 phage putative head morphogenesis protein, SPP1 gp7 family [Hespellia stercorisuis DSM 15480]
MNSADYWKKREAENLKKNLKTEEEYAKTISSYYDYMMDQCQKEINGFYTKYASAEGITLVEAKRRVSKLDIEAYGRKAARYVQNKDLSDQANEEMRLYNATMKINRLEMLKANIGLELVDGFDELQKFFGEKLTDRTLSEFERMAGILGATIENSSKKAEAIVNASFNNAKYSDRIWMYQDMMKAELSKLLQTGLIQGRNPRQLARHLEKLFGVQKSNAERLMRTELARVQIEAQKQSFERNGFTKYEFIALGNACDICRAIDGKHFDVAKMMPGENAPPMHPNCRCSVACWEDDEDYEEWLDYLDKGGITEQWNELKKHREKSIMEPEDRGDLHTSLNQLSDNLSERSLQVNNYLNTLGLPESKWSGRTIVKENEIMGTSIGKKVKSCDIWLREDATTKTIIHEHLHARSISRNPDIYGKYHIIEEATVELLSEEICKRNKIPFTKSYIQETKALRDIADALGYKELYSFSKELAAVDADKRKEWINTTIERYQAKHKIKGKWKAGIFDTSKSILFGDE